MVILNLNNQDMELRYDFNSICAIEERSGKGIHSLMKEDVAGLNLLRLLVWAGLRWKNPNISIDIVGTWIGQEIKKGSKIDYFAEKSMKALIDSGVLGNMDENVVEGE
jgi:hypothetical protein